MEEETKNNYELKKQERENTREDERKKARVKKSFTRYIFWIFIVVELV